MRHILRISSLVLSFVFVAHTSLAQSTENTDQTETDELLNLGTPVDDGPKIGDRYLANTHGDWSVICIKSEQDQDPCQMSQLITDGQDAPVAEVIITRLPAGGQAVAGATLLTPLNTLLTEQVTVSVDNNTGKRYPFTVCQEAGCVARLGFTEEDLNAYKAGAVATITIFAFTAPDRPINLALSLSGFTAAYEGLD